ncbi:MAG: hypothetical protein CBC06_001705 [bacterium TMED46]|nr:MAG: hypothetical protein CBC06_001705 [bacterium TMED46]|tara:strand:- start:3743 stop:4318 length:576 start_codon:yes stop_codon:yes gene_type:complete
MAEKRNIILFGSMILLTISYWLTASILIGDKPFEIRVLEEEQQELNENLISAQILASQLDRVFTLFQENLALSKADSLADDASLPFLNNLTDVLEELDIKLLGIKPKPRIDKITYFKAPYIVTLECSYDQFGKFLSELERSPRLITIDEFEVKNGIERIKANTDEEKLIYQEFVVSLSTITLVKSKSKVVS